MKTRHERLIHPWNLPNTSEPDSVTSQVPVQARSLTLAERKAQRRWRERLRSRTRYWSEVEESRAYQRDYRSRWNKRNPDKVRVQEQNRYERLKADPLAYACKLQDNRDSRHRHRDERVAYNREYLDKNRDTINAQRRAQYAQKPDYISREDRVQRARAREAWIVMLRGLGLSWKQVAERVGTTAQTCQATYQQAMKRRGQQKANQEKRLANRRERDAFLLSSYCEGMTWEEYAKATGYHNKDSAWSAYNRALERATRPESQNNQQQVLDTRTFEQEAFKLRQQGHSFRLIGAMLGRTDVACGVAYRRYLKRQQQHTHEQSA